MKKIILIIILISLVACVTTKNIKPTGITFYLKNETSVLCTYFLWWIDHPYQDQIYGPFSFAGGELESGKEYVWESNYDPEHIYIIEWRIDGETVKLVEGISDILTENDLQALRQERFKRGI